MAERAPVLVLTGLPDPVRAALAQAVELRDAPGGDVRAIITNGGRGVSGAEIKALPALERVLTIGVGFEAVDVEALAARGIPLITARGTNEDAVADHALALLLASVRRLADYDAGVRSGVRFQLLPASLSNKRLGVLGLGEIGLRVARRAEAFGLVVGYHNRRRRDDVAYAYYESAKALAAASDYLIVTAPGGQGTRHLVDADVLSALGAEGRIVNVGRGSVIDTQALLDALRDDRIAGAGLDVLDGDPAAFADLRNVILTPHIAATSPERNTAMARHLLNHLAGLSLKSAPAHQGAWA